MPAYAEQYNYQFGKYLMIKKFGKVNEQVLEKAGLLVEWQEITVDESGNNYLLFKEGSPFDNIVKPIEAEIQSALGNIFEGYEGLENSEEADDCKRYLRVQYHLTAIALRFFGHFSPAEAAFEAAFLGKQLLRSRCVPEYLSIPVKTKKGFLDVYILPYCLNICLVVKYLEQLGLSKNQVKDKKLVARIRQGMRRLEEEMKKRKLTAEEWEAREKTKSKIRARY